MMKTLNTLLKQFSRHRQLLFCAAHFLGYFHLRRHIPLRRHIYTRTAPNLFLTKTTKLTSHGTSRYPASSSYPIRSPTATLYQKKPTRVLRFWKTLEVRSSRSPIITSSSFCRTNLLSSNNLFRAKLRQVRHVRVFSRSVCSRGLRVCGGCGGVGEYGRVE